MCCCASSWTKKKKKKLCMCCLLGWGLAAQSPRAIRLGEPRLCVFTCSIFEAFRLGSGSVEALGGSGRPHGHLGHFQVKRRPRVGPPVNAPSPHRTSFRPHPQIPSIQICLAAVIEPPAACQRGWSKREVS